MVQKVVEMRMGRQQSYNRHLVNEAANEVCGLAYEKVRPHYRASDLTMLGAAAQIVMEAPRWTDDMKVAVLRRVEEKITKDGWE
jgi:hypothetical protein